VRKIIEQLPADAWIPIPYWLEDGADVAETRYRPFGKKGPLVRLIVRRVRPTPGSQLALFTEYDYHPFITDRVGGTLALEADHRRHAEVEPAIGDLKHGAGLQHLPSGHFGANAAWLAVCGMAYNLARWTGRLGVGEGRMSTKTLPVRYLALPGRLSVSARRLTLHLPARWPWQWRWEFTLARLRCIPHRPDRAACGYREVAPAAPPGRAAACPDTARTATATPTRATWPRTTPPGVFHSPFPARLGVQQTRDCRSQSARRWNQA